MLVNGSSIPKNLYWIFDAEFMSFECEMFGFFTVVQISIIEVVHGSVHRGKNHQKKTLSTASDILIASPQAWQMSSRWTFLERLHHNTCNIPDSHYFFLHVS